MEECVRLGMAAEQMVDFLPTWGLRLSRSQVYDYLSALRLPRSYRRAEGDQSHHDYFTFRFFIRMAQDAARAGYATRKLLKGRLAYEGAKFRPDFKFELGPYRYFLELQLSDLTETRWTVKFANYFRLRATVGRHARALFVLDQKGDLAYIRRTAREFLRRKGREDMGLFLFVSLDELKGGANTAADAVWMTPWGERQSLLQWLPQPGPKPSDQC